MVIEISTDGSAWPNPGTGGWAALFRYKNHVKAIYGWEQHSTNIRMEMWAAIKALEHLKQPCDIILYTDSQFVINGITLWIHRWKKNGYLTKPTPKQPEKPVVNRDLWERLDLATRRHTIQWVWIKGHANHPDNITCDQLAGKARKKKIEGILDLSEKQMPLVEPVVRSITFDTI